MNPDEIKLEIKDRISKTDKTFITKLGTETTAGITGNDIVSLEILLKKVNRFFKFYKISAIICSVTLIVFSILKYFDYINHLNMNKSGLFILFTIVFLITAFNYQKVKVSLENKIWLLKLLDRIEKS